MTTITNVLSMEVAQATEALGQNLAASEPMRRYQAAEQALTENEEAYSLLRRFAQQQGELRQRQSQGTLTQAHLADLRELQEQVQQNHLIMTYFRAQEQVNAYLQEINQEISTLIGADFAGLARVSGCC
ncbi:MAG: YlbF family regulator [Anaerolineae bacterium]|nr:YlbF family regulator [Anaerolineae bacterium]